MLQGIQRSRTNGRGLIVCPHARRPADRIGSLLIDSRGTPSARARHPPPTGAGLTVARGREARPGHGGGPGGPSGVVPPVPFPNTVVKRPSAYDTA